MKAPASTVSCNGRDPEAERVIDPSAGWILSAAAPPMVNSPSVERDGNRRKSRIVFVKGAMAGLETYEAGVPEALQGHSTLEPDSAAAGAVPPTNAMIVSSAAVS